MLHSQHGVNVYVMTVAILHKGTHWSTVMCCACVTQVSTRIGHLPTESARQLGFDHLKDKQLEATSAFVAGNDTFVSLPTGYSKFAVYAVLLYAFDNLRGRRC